MNREPAGHQLEQLDDGLGTRRLETVGARAVEVLDVAPPLAQHPAFEAEVRARASRLSDLCVNGLAPVHRIDRDGARLSIVSAHIDGIRLPDLLRAAPLPGPARLALAARVVHAVVNAHMKPGLSHGAITPAHVVVGAAGIVSLTDCVFGGALESLQRNRDQLWREFRVAMPASATLPRFDVRADVAQLGTTVLSILLGRLMADDEYPRPVMDLVNTAIADAAAVDADSVSSRLHMWLQQALQLHPRENFANAVEAERGYSAMMRTPGAQRAAAVALQGALHEVTGLLDPTRDRLEPVIRSLALGPSVTVSRASTHP